MQTSSQSIVPGESHLNLACLEMKGRLYAVDVTQVREIVRYQEITPLPKAPALIEGVVDLRGAVVPVIDLGRALGTGRVEVGPQARIVVLELDGLVIGLAVDGASDVLSLEPSALEDPPALATHAGYDAVRAVIRREEESPVMVLSLESILESVYRSALDGERVSHG